jgi:hypothetical protein
VPPASDLQSPSAGGARCPGSTVGPLRPMAKLGGLPPYANTHRSAVLLLAWSLSTGDWAVCPLLRSGVCALHILRRQGPLRAPTCRRRWVLCHQWRLACTEACSRVHSLSPPSRVTGASTVLLSKLSVGVADSAAGRARRAAVLPLSA